MNDQNPLWHTFINRLCERMDKRACEHDHGQSQWALQDMGMPNEDITLSIEGFRERNACCDCEILFNLVNWEAGL